MNCDDAKYQLVVNAEAALTPEVGAHLEACPACRTFATRDAAVRDLLAVEAARPADVELEERIVRGVRDRIERAPWWTSLRLESVDPSTWRWTTAAAAALLLTLFVWNRATQDTSEAPELMVRTPTEFRPVLVTPAQKPETAALLPPRLRVMAGNENDSDATNMLPNIQLEPLPGEGMLPVNYQP